MHQNVALVKTTREAVGDNVDIMADAYMGWNLEHARRMLRMLAPYNIRWVEEPVISDDLHAYAEFKALNIVNISGGEHEYTIHGFRDALDLKAFDIAQFDVNRVGGITAASGRSRQRALLVHFDGEPVAKDGFIDLSDTAPGFGLTLKPVDANFKLTR